MSLDTKGTAHIFGIQAGIGAVTDATVQSFSNASSKQNLSTTNDEIGNEIERRSDDLVQEVNITLRIQSDYTIPAVSDVLVYDSVKYDILTVDVAESNGAHVIVTITAKTTEYVTLP